MSTAVKWVDYNPDETYDLTTAFPKLQLPLRMNNQDRIKIAVCSSCKTVKNHHFPPVLAAIPEEINVVPMVYCKHISPIHMSCSLGHASGSNHYTNYRHLQGFIGLSKNKHALNLHSGMIGAFLDQGTEPPNWFHESLINASRWLKQNNPIFKQYNNNRAMTRSSPSDPFPEPLPTARLVS
ncbi:8767_t:CDS:1 [Entrophospora sp. SA101]|nr:8767_t:CDS:1 [Entrophospora sp. SA101]